MRRTLALALGGLTLAAGAGCESEPGRLCDRIRIIWPFFDVDAEDDVAAADGIQIDIELPTGLSPGSQAVLSVIGPDDVATPHPEAAVADEDGGLHFTAVTLPIGRVELSLVASDECGPVSSARRLYVWDALGYPVCQLSLGVTPEPSDEFAPLGVIDTGDDVEPDTAGIQIPIAVEAGRPDMEVALFVREVATATDAVTEQDSGEDRVADFVATLPSGEVAVRAVCTWPPEDLRPSSHTEHFVVVEP